jgi:hypothetical protein
MPVLVLAPVPVVVVVVVALTAMEAMVTSDGEVHVQVNEADVH